MTPQPIVISIFLKINILSNSQTGLSPSDLSSAVSFGLLAPSRALYVTMRNFFKFSLSPKPHCHKSCSKLLQYHECNLGELDQRTLLTQLTQLTQQIKNNPVEVPKYTLCKYIDNRQCCPIPLPKIIFQK